MSHDSPKSFWTEEFPRCARPDQPLGRMTTLRVGGPALVLSPRSIDELREIACAARERGERLRAIGLGANLVVSDDGVLDPVVSTRQLRECRFEGRTVRAGAGALLPALVSASARRGLSGLEPLVGIPATVGGAVAMNAGGRYGNTFDRLSRVAVLTARGEVEEREPAALKPEYRRTNLADGEIVVEASFELDSEQPDRVMGRTHDVLSEKSVRQPLDAWSAGCIFKNPSGSRSAGQLIEGAGLKGLSLGGAVVSEKHANFIVNRRDATASDVHALIDAVRQRVRSRFGVDLDLEVRRWDREPGPATLPAPVLQPT